MFLAIPALDWLLIVYFIVVLLSCNLQMFEIVWIDCQNRWKPNRSLCRCRELLQLNSADGVADDRSPIFIKTLSVQRYGRYISCQPINRSVRTQFRQTIVKSLSYKPLDYLVIHLLNVRLVLHLNCQHDDKQTSHVLDDVRKEAQWNQIKMCESINQSINDQLINRHNS